MGATRSANTSEVPYDSRQYWIKTITSTATTMAEYFCYRYVWRLIYQERVTEKPEPMRYDVGELVMRRCSDSMATTACSSTAGVPAMLRKGPLGGSYPFSLSTLKEIGRCIAVLAILRRLSP